MTTETSSTFSASTTTLPNQTVAQLLLEYLKLEGVDKIFGIPGGAVIFIIDQLRRQTQNFDFIVCRHETGAAYMADGYYRVTGKLGVVLTTAGPSAINAVTGSMNAQAGNSSVLTITGEVPEKFFGEAYLQEGVDARLDVNAIYRNSVKYSTLIPSPVAFKVLIEQALRDARSIPAQAAHISIPNDVAGTCVAPSGSSITFPASPASYRASPSATDLSRIDRAFVDLANARKPLIFLGNGARHALRDGDRLRRFTEFVHNLAIPVMTTPDGKGIFGETQPMSLRNYGMTACAWPQMYMGKTGTADHFDALLVVGSSLGELATSPAATKHYDPVLVPSGPFAQIDADQSVIGRAFPVTNGIVGEVAASLDALLNIAGDFQPSPEQADAINTRRALISQIKQTSPFEYPDARAGNAVPLHPAAAMRVINQQLDGAHVFIDAGNCVGWSLNNLVIDPPNQFHIALGMGPMGFGVGAVVGGKIGAPDADCIAIVGDGAFMMHGAEISTAAQNKVGAIWVVLSDNDLSMVSQGMAELFPPASDWTDFYKLGAPDLVKFSQGLGADAVAITQGPDQMAAELQTARTRARQDRKPQVLVLDIDTRPMPKYGWPDLKAPVCS